MQLGRYQSMLVLAGLAMLLGAACSSGDDDDDSVDATPASCTPVPAESAVVDQDGLKFKPSTLCVKAGQEVLFKNSETAVHTVDIEGKNESGTMKKGDEFRWTPPQAGTFDITCEFHPQMKAIVTVVS